MSGIFPPSSFSLAAFLLSEACFLKPSLWLPGTAFPQLIELAFVIGNDPAIDDWLIILAGLKAHTGQESNGLIFIFQFPV